MLTRGEVSEKTRPKSDVGLRTHEIKEVERTDPRDSKDHDSAVRR